MMVEINTAKHPVFDSNHLMKTCDICLMGERCKYYKADSNCTFTKQNLENIRHEWEHRDSAEMLFDTIAELRNTLEVGKLRYKSFPSISIIKGYDTLGYLIDRYYRVVASSEKKSTEAVILEIEAMKKSAQLELIKAKVDGPKKEKQTIEAKVETR